MNFSPWSHLLTSVRGVMRGLSCAALATAAGLLVGHVPALANGLGENGSWQFQTQQDRVNKGAVADMIERKKAGYYDAIKPVYNYTTYIDKQVNCSVSAATSGNTGTNATTASTSSPTVTNSGATNSTASSNTASNGVSQAGLSGVIQMGTTTPAPSGSVDNAQNNTGSLSSGVNGSNTAANTGAVSSNGGTTTQALNSNQTSTGTLTASISGSSACIGPLNGQ